MIFDNKILIVLNRDQKKWSINNNKSIIRIQSWNNKSNRIRQLTWTQMLMTTKFLTLTISLISKMSKRMAQKIVRINPPQEVLQAKETEMVDLMANLSPTCWLSQIVRQSKRIWTRDMKPSDKLMMRKAARELRKGLLPKLLKRSARGESSTMECLYPITRLIKLNCSDGRLRTQLPRSRFPRNHSMTTFFS